MRSNRVSNEIFFLDARSYATPGRIQNIFSKNSIGEISLIVKEQRTIPGKSKIVTLEEIAAQDYTINAPRYVGNAEHTTSVGDMSFTDRKLELNNEINGLTNSIEVLLSAIKRLKNR